MRFNALNLRRPCGYQGMKGGPTMPPMIPMVVPMAHGLDWLAVVVVAGMLAVVGLVARAGRQRPRPRVSVTRLPARVPEAA